MRTLVDVVAPDPGGVRSLLIEHRAEVIEVAARHGVTNVRVFGSLARGDHHQGSDVDLLVDFGPGVSLYTVAGLRRELAAVLGVTVDIVGADALLPRDHDIRDQAVGL